MFFDFLKFVYLSWYIFGTPLISRFVMKMWLVLACSKHTMALSTLTHFLLKTHLFLSLLGFSPHRDACFKKKKLIFLKTDSKVDTFENSYFELTTKLKLLKQWHILGSLIVVLAALQFNSGNVSLCTIHGCSGFQDILVWKGRTWNMLVWTKSVLNRKPHFQTKTLECYSGCGWLPVMQLLRRRGWSDSIVT